MSPLGEFVVALAILAGLFGIVLPFLPGLLLIVAAVVVWAFAVGTPIGWAVAVVVLAIGVGGTIFKYLVPGRRLKEVGLPTSTLVIAIGVAIVGLFVIPVIGAPIGFVATIYLAERVRVGAKEAWPTTKTSLGAVAASIGIELATGLIIAALWFGAVIFD
ncbi:MAG TPA: DUF456 domain-containing protein [Acidimicrobiia bacterium]